MRTRVECTGTVQVPLPAANAFALFTPEGERRWVEGWSPTYPGSGRTELSEGLVFQTGTEAGRSTWMVARLEPIAHHVSYVYVLPDHRAVLVDVRVEGEDGASKAYVTYHMTALSAEGDSFVQEFASGYDAFLQEWEAAILRHVVDGEEIRKSR